MRRQPGVGVPITHLKNVFLAELGVAPSPQLLEILVYACGLNIGPALTLNQNPNFETASSRKDPRGAAQAGIPTPEMQMLLIDARVCPAVVFGRRTTKLFGGLLLGVYLVDK